MINQLDDFTGADTCSFFPKGLWQLLALGRDTEVRRQHIKCLGLNGDWNQTGLGTQTGVTPREFHNAAVI